MQSYSQNPMTYLAWSDVNIYIKRNFAPIETRVNSIIAIENEAPKIFSAARANLAESLPKPFLETAIEMANGAIEFLTDTVLAEGVPAAMIIGRMAGVPNDRSQLNDGGGRSPGRLRRRPKLIISGRKLSMCARERFWKMVEKRGRYGRKNGKGFYDYPQAGQTVARPC